MKLSGSTRGALFLNMHKFGVEQCMHEINSCVKVNLWLANPLVYVCIEQLILTLIRTNKKFELMLTKRAKVYSNSLSLCLCLFPAISIDRNSLLECVLQPKIAKINKNPYLRSSGSFKATDVNTTKNWSLVLVVICSMPMPICNRFYERLANNVK